VDVAQSGYGGGDLAALGEGGLRPGFVIAWRLAHFDELSPRELHDIYQARVEVFVVEQKCPFQDVDGADPECWHLVGRSAAGSIVAYCRLVPPGTKFAEPSIGRV